MIRPMNFACRFRCLRNFPGHFALASLLLNSFLAGAADPTLPDSQPLTVEGDLSEQMISGIDRFLMQGIEASKQTRQQYWNPDFSSRAAYEKSIAGNRARFQSIIGAVDERLNEVELTYQQSFHASSLLARTERYTVYAVQWPVFPGVHAEGLMLLPSTEPTAAAVVLPDADQTPEQQAGLAPGLDEVSQWARRLAENGCLVLTPTLIDRDDTWSGNALLNRYTNQPHREWIYRQAYEAGRHIIGYEVQKVQAAVDWFEQNYPSLPIGVAGYGEGGLVAMYSGAVDSRIDSTLVSGYFQARERVWEEPIYRNVFGLLEEFGDAEIVRLIAPRRLVVEYSEAPEVNGPPPQEEQSGRRGAAPGKLRTPGFEEVELEVRRAAEFFEGHPGFEEAIQFAYGNEGLPVRSGSRRALRLFLERLGISRDEIIWSGEAPVSMGSLPDHSARQKRQVEELTRFTQQILRRSERIRDTEFWQSMGEVNAASWEARSRPFKQHFAEAIIGRFADPNQPINPRTRLLEDNDQWTLYEVMLDVWNDVFASGYLLIPKDLKPEEKRPVVVCLSGLETVPADAVYHSAKGYGVYKAFAARLADQGFIAYVPRNPYRGGERFRELQRKADSLGKSLDSIILGQHQRTLGWLADLPFVDAERIALYGVSHGGQTALRIAPLLDQYRVVICSAAFNEWIRKCASAESPRSYLYSGEYEMLEFNLAHTLDNAEMAALIAPRPFMVERGHFDEDASDEWVAYEYAKVRRFYSRLGMPSNTEIEFFIGPHTVNGVGTFDFLHKHLKWPEP